MGTRVAKTGLSNGKFCAESILLADKEPVFLRGLRTIIEEESRFRVIDVATDSKTVVAQLSRHQPGFLVTGFRLACGRDTLGLVPEIRSRSQDTAIIVLLPRSSSLLAGRLVSSGVRGVLDRCAPTDAIVVAIQKVLGGEIFVDPAFIATPVHCEFDSKQADLSGLTDREREILHLLGMEKTYIEIASLLGISSKTVERHRENIKAKLCFGTACALHLYAKANVIWEACGVDYVI